MKILYLIQAPDFMPYPDLSGSGREVILLTWKSPVAQSTIHMPGSSWNTGRNRLLEEANKRDYDYLVFLDDDLIITTATGRSVWDEFEEFLVNWEPAIGYGKYQWQQDSGGEADLNYNMDACFNAFHKETVPVLLPYTTSFDNVSWHYSQAIIIALLDCMYPLNRVQCNSITVVNSISRPYPRDNQDFFPLQCFLREILRTEAVGQHKKLHRAFKNR